MLGLACRDANSCFLQYHLFVFPLFHYLSLQSSFEGCDVITCIVKGCAVKDGGLAVSQKEKKRRNTSCEQECEEVIMCQGTAVCRLVLSERAPRRRTVRREEGLYAKTEAPKSFSVSAFSLIARINKPQRWRPSRLSVYSHHLVA